MTYDDFRKFGRLGCSECYNAFREQLAVLLKKIHGSNQHLGKAPSKLPQPIKKKIDQLQELKRQLQRAIEAESFEEAAALRDKIRGLEKKGEG